MKLDEILGKPTEYKITLSTDKFFTAEFSSGTRRIRFNATRLRGGNGGVWEVDFAELTKNANGSEYENTKKTGSGNEFEVFATVKALITTFIEKYSPAQLNLDSSKAEGNRAKLYQKLIAKNLPAGWKIERDESHPSYITFVLTKVKDSPT
jgi:hypothetical protein